jgi:hypothetical protein
MRLRRHRRNVVIWSSPGQLAGRNGIVRYRPPTRAAQLRRCIRIGALLAVIAVRPRWRPLLAGMVLTVAGYVLRGGVVSVIAIPGLMLLWQALMTPASTGADRQRRAQLERELAAFSTPAQRCDLQATLDRYPDGMTGEIRAILASQAMAASSHGIPGAGR